MPSDRKIEIKRIDDQLVVGVRRVVRSEAEIQGEIAALREPLEGRIGGPPVCLYLARDPKRGSDVEICIPVDEPLQLAGAFCRRLPGGTVIWTRHRGALDPDDRRSGLRGTVLSLWNAIGDARLLVGDDPRRSVYLEGPETHGDRVEDYVTEIQLAYHLPIWIDALERGLTARVGPGAARDVLAGRDRILSSRDADEIRHWVEAALERFDRTLPDKRTRACVMNGCAHRHPRRPLETWRAAYEASGSLATFLRRIETDKDLYPPRTWREPDRLDVLYVERVIPPGSEAAYAAAATPEEKRFHACFCTLMKDAILSGEPVSASFCHCSAGWFVQIWEAILGRTLRVDVVQSVLQGADRCVFAIHLPRELL
jgi:hypothetical protein